METHSRPDLLAKALHSVGYFRGKGRLADALGRSIHSRNNGLGTFPLPDGKSVTVDLGDRIQRLMWGAAYEPHVKSCIAALLRPGDTFVDVGAHIGFFSLLAAGLVGSTGKVYSFEAESTLFQTLQANSAEYSWLQAYWKAVWDASGLISFSNPRELGESGWGKVASVRNEGNVVSVEAICLDDWHESVGFRPIRLLKIDAEGSELFILKGARRLISNTLPYLIIELNDQLLFEVHQSTQMIVESLNHLGYTIFTMGSKGYRESRDYTTLSSPEILCVPTKLKEGTKAIIAKL